MSEEKIPQTSKEICEEALNIMDQQMPAMFAAIDKCTSSKLKQLFKLALTFPLNYNVKLDEGKDDELDALANATRGLLNAKHVLMVHTALTPKEELESIETKEEQPNNEEKEDE